jgi:hypothetical protein
MMTDLLLPLAQTSLRDPRAGAQAVIDQGFGRDVLWTALALVAVANTLLVLLLMRGSAPAMPMPGYADAPLALFVIIAGLLVVYVHAMYWAGLAIGGQGTLNDVLAVLVWFQALRAAAQMLVIIVSLAFPAMGLILSLVVAVWGFWIFLNFVATALNLRTVWHSLLVLVLAGVGLILGLGILLSLIGLGAQGA